MNIGDTVTIKHDPKRRPFKIYGLRCISNFEAGKYVITGKVATVSMDAWGQKWVAMVPVGDLEEVEK